jgi:serine O-acetyltransferase
MNKVDLKTIIIADKQYYKKSMGIPIVDFLLNRPSRKIFKYIYHMRHMEFYGARDNLISKLLYVYHYYFYTKLSYTLGYQIPAGTCGKGLTLYHWGSIIVNGRARLGDYCRLYPGVIIGSTEKGVPQIGNNVYVGGGSKIIGNISIGNNVIIAPNSIVNKNVPANVIVAGVPAKVIKNIGKEDFPRLSGYLRPIE